MGLLNYITATSVDEDYAYVHSLRKQRGAAPTRKPGLLAVAIFGVFGALVATAAVQTARTAGVDEQSHASLVSQVNNGRDLLETSRDRLVELQGETAAAQRQNRSATIAEQSVTQLVNRLGTASGIAPRHRSRGEARRRRRGGRDL